MNVNAPSTATRTQHKHIKGARTSYCIPFAFPIFLQSNWKRLFLTFSVCCYFSVLTTSKVKSKLVQTCDSMHLWWPYNSGGGQQLLNRYNFRQVHSSNLHVTQALNPNSHCPLWRWVDGKNWRRTAWLVGAASWSEVQVVAAAGAEGTLSAGRTH